MSKESDITAFAEAILDLIETYGLNFYDVMGTFEFLKLDLYEEIKNQAESEEE